MRRALQRGAPRRHSLRLVARIRVALPPVRGTGGSLHLYPSVSDLACALGRDAHVKYPPPAAIWPAHHINILKLARVNEERAKRNPRG